MIFIEPRFLFVNVQVMSSFASRLMVAVFPEVVDLWSPTSPVQAMLSKSQPRWNYFGYVICPNVLSNLVARRLATLRFQRDEAADQVASKREVTVTTDGFLDDGDCAGWRRFLHKRVGRGTGYRVIDLQLEWIYNPASYCLLCTPAKFAAILCRSDPPVGSLRRRYKCQNGWSPIEWRSYQNE